MSINRYKRHLLILPEDDANRQIANGFLLHTNVNQCVLRLERVSGGWRKAVDSISTFALETFRDRHLLLLLDFDNDLGRREKIFKQLPRNDCTDRVYILGCRTEPEAFPKNVRNLEKIGRDLAEACVSDDFESSLWNDEQLFHNLEEAKRLRTSLKGVIFQL